MTVLALIVLCVAAAFEVGGDTVIRTGLRGRRPLITVVGMLMLGLYGLVVNQLRWDFSHLCGGRGRASHVSRQPSAVSR